MSSIKIWQPGQNKQIVCVILDICIVSEQNAIKRKEVVGQYKKAGSKGRYCRTLERGSDEKHSLVYLHFVLKQYIIVV